MRTVPFTFENNRITFNGHELMIFEAEPDTPERHRENHNAGVIISSYGGFENLPTASDEAGKARWREIKAQYDQRQRDRRKRRPS